MKKLILFLTALFLITGCSSDDSENGGYWNPGNWNWSSNNTYLGIFGGAVIGGVLGAAGAAVTSAVSASIGIGGLAGGATSGFISGYGMAGLHGGSGNPLERWI